MNAELFLPCAQGVEALLAEEGVRLLGDGARGPVWVRWRLPLLTGRARPFELRLPAAGPEWHVVPSGELAAERSAADSRFTTARP